jgi:hypothetical protein
MVRTRLLAVAVVCAAALLVGAAPPAAPASAPRFCYVIDVEQTPDGGARQVAVRAGCRGRFVDYSCGGAPVSLCY